MNRILSSSPKGRMVSTWKMSLEGLKKGSRLLQEGKPVHEAILCAVREVEDNENYVSVGYGGLPNREGQVELDAAYMDGDTLGCGAVMAVKDVKNPIETAYKLSLKNRSCILAGGGAERYAERNGAKRQNMLTENSRNRYLREKDQGAEKATARAYEGHDTVCVIGRQGTHLACGVSTSGLYMKEPGRVGDSPLIGSGFYADSQAGAAAATGAGEDIMKGCLSFAIVEKMREGMEVQKACELCLEQHVKRLEKRGYQDGGMSVIAMDPDGNAGAATTLEEFPFVVAGEDSCQVLIASRNRETGKQVLFSPDEEWLKNSRAD